MNNANVVVFCQYNVKIRYCMPMLVVKINFINVNTRCYLILLTFYVLYIFVQFTCYVIEIYLIFYEVNVYLFLCYIVLNLNK